MSSRKHTEETKKKISEARKKYLQKNPDKVPYLLNHHSRGESYPEKYFREILEKTDLNFEINYPYSIYELDFAFLEKSIDLEIDGSQHTDDIKIVKSNLIRDAYMKERLWTTIRVDWREYQKMERSEKEKYIKILIDYIKEKQFIIPIIINKEKNSICECGNVKHYRSKQCSKCSKLKQRKVKDRPDKNELLKMINETSLESVGRKYGVTGKAIKKWLK